MLGVFDCYAPPYSSNHSIWILQTINPGLVEHLPDSGPIRTSAVSKAGDIYPKFCKDFEPHTDVNPPYWLVTYLLNPSPQHEFVIKDEQGNVVGQVTNDEVIPDMRLIAEEPGEDY